MPESLLQHSLAMVRRRLLSIGMAAGAGWALAAMLLLLIFFAWVDLAVDLPPTVRAICGWGVLIMGLATLLKAAFAAFGEASATTVAHRLDRIAGTGGQVLTGVDLLRQYGSGVAIGTTAPLSHGLARIAIERAAKIATQVSVSAAAPARPVGWAYGAFGGIAVLVGALGVFAPRLVASQWLRLTDPYGDHPPYSSIELSVEPGDTKVRYGSSLDVRATSNGGTLEHVELVFQSDSGSIQETVPMFPEPGGAWRAAVSDVTSAGRYFVRATQSRTRKFHYDVITVPELRGLRFRVTPPAYTHRPPYEGPLPQGGLSGLAGTKVEFWARSNRPLSGGAFEFETDPGATTRPAAATPAAQVSVAPSSADAAEVVGSFFIDRPGKMKLTIIDIDHQPALDPFVAMVTVLSDARPFVRIIEPRPESFATPDVTLNVQIAAEDDYGISRLELFRGLNDSRVLPTDIPVPPSQPTRLPASVPLNLADYGLEPGDVVKLYARVEDNDPAGAKGSETPVVMIHVISKEDFDRMVLAREGLEVLEAKYAQAMRRLEALDNQIAAEQEEIKKLPPDSALSDAKRKDIEKLAEQMDDAAKAVAEAGKQDLPFDIDKNLRQKLDEVAQDIRDAAKEVRQETAGQNPGNGQAERSLEKARDRLGARKAGFKQQAADPLEHLAKIYPLVEDEARFVELWRRQRDLAERMKSVMVASVGDDPAVKARVRDLQTEQRNLRQDLAELLGDIENHAAALPPDDKPAPQDKPAPDKPAPGKLAPDKPADPGRPSMEELRKSAVEFVRAARQSGASEQMAEAEQKLEDFAAAPAGVKSREAADSLEALIAKSKSMGDQGESEMRFQPSLAQILGNTVDQLLESAGLSANPGRGTGSGGGFSQRRSSLRNVGLYGRRPTGKPGGATGGGRLGGPGAGAPGDGQQADQSTGLANTGRLQASGASDAAVPPQYRKKVGDYFQRVADELGDH
jgi:hypothetical protein